MPLSPEALAEQRQRTLERHLRERREAGFPDQITDPSFIVWMEGFLRSVADRQARESAGAISHPTSGAKGVLPHRAGPSSTPAPAGEAS